MQAIVDSHLTHPSPWKRASTAAKLWSKLVRSYAMDALPEPQPKSVAQERARRLVNRLVGAQVEVYPSLALGQDLRLQGDRALVSAPGPALLLGEPGSGKTTPSSSAPPTSSAQARPESRSYSSPSPASAPSSSPSASPRASRTSTPPASPATCSSSPTATGDPRLVRP